MVYGRKNIQKNISRVFGVFLVVLILVGNVQIVRANEGKISKSLQHAMSKAADETLIPVMIEFDSTIDTQSIKNLTSEAITYEERYHIIQAIYKNTIDTFISAYFGADASRILQKNYDYSNIVVDITKSEISVLAQDSTVVQMYLYSEFEGFWENSFHDSPELMPTFWEVKAAAIADLLGYVDLSVYRQEQQAEIKEILDYAIDGINSARSSESIYAVVADTEIQLDAIKTDAELKLEENGTKDLNQPEPLTTDEVESHGQTSIEESKESSDSVEKDPSTQNDSESGQVCNDQKENDSAQEMVQSEVNNDSTQVTPSVENPIKSSDSSTDSSLDLQLDEDKYLAEHTDQKDFNFAALLLICLNAGVSYFIWYFVKKKK